METIFMLGVLALGFATGAVLLCSLEAFRDPVSAFMRNFIRASGVLLAILVAMFVAVVVTPALAQAAAAAAPSTLLNIPQSFWNELNGLLAALFLALGGVAVQWILVHTRVGNAQTQDLARQGFSRLMDTAAQYGLSQLGAAESRVGAVDVGSPTVAAAANFAILHGPDLAAKLGFDVKTDAGRNAIIQSVTARIANMATPAGTPPQPVPLPPEVSAKS